MRRFAILVLVALGVALLQGTLTAQAQDILGLSVLPDPAMPAGTNRGSADIIRADDGSYLVSVDLSGAAEALDFDDFEGATAWVVWVVDMNGVRHNVGALNDNFVLEDATVDALVARIFLTAEAAADVTGPSEDRLFAATLRDVEEVESVEPAPEAAEAAEAAEEEAPAPTPVPATEPEVLPTTGGLLHDLLVLAAVAAALLLVSLKLRAVRV